MFSPLLPISNKPTWLSYDPGRQTISLSSHRNIAEQKTYKQGCSQSGQPRSDPDLAHAHLGGSTRVPLLRRPRRRLHLVGADQSPGRRVVHTPPGRDPPVFFFFLLL